MIILLIVSYLGCRARSTRTIDLFGLYLGRLLPLAEKLL